MNVGLTHILFTFAEFIVTKVKKASYCVLGLVIVSVFILGNKVFLSKLLVSRILNPIVTGGLSTTIVFWPDTPVIQKLTALSTSASRQFKLESRIICTSFTRNIKIPF